MMPRLLVAAALIALALSLDGVHAAPLDAATCGQLKGEQVRMEQGGVRDRMAKGPSWAKANLTADKIAEVRRLIELDEQLLFRCSTRNLIELPAEADADPPPAAPGASEDGKDAATPKADAASPAGQKKPAAKSPPGDSAKAPVAKAAPKDTAKTAPAASKAAPPAKKPAPAKDAVTAPPPEKAAAAKPKPKAKVDDAFKAPPPNPNVDPFANQPARQ
jgi:hypothetical protein